MGDQIALSSIPGVGRKARSGEVTVGNALEVFTGTPRGDTGTVLVFANRGYTRLSPTIKNGIVSGVFTKEDSIFSRYHSTTTPAMVIDENGNIGIGFGATSTMAYKLQVHGDIGAQSFINLSTRTAKENIEHLTEAEYTNALDMIRDTDLATYNYIGECAALAGASSTIPGTPCKKRLGLIAEEAPSQILSVDGKGVDLYQTIALVFAATKAQDERIAKLEAALGTIDPTTIAPSKPNTTGIIDQGVAWIVAQFGKLGIAIKNGVVQATSFVAETMEAKKGTLDELKAKKAELGGIEMVDEQTGETYCIKISGGDWKKTVGVCGSNTPVPTTPDMPLPAAVEPEQILPTEDPIVAPEETPAEGSEAAAIPVDNNVQGSGETDTIGG